MKFYNVSVLRCIWEIYLNIINYSFFFFCLEILMTNLLNWKKKRNPKICVKKQNKIISYLEDFKTKEEGLAILNFSLSIATGSTEPLIEEGLGNDQSVRSI